MPTKRLSSKICLVGDGGVGKTSLIGRYVYDVFNDKYLTTIGTKVTRKEIIFDIPDRDLQITMDAMIWDIMGQKAFKALFHQAYFRGARGIIGVCNLTDVKTLGSLIDWVDSVTKTVGDIPMVLLANKRDLKEEVQLSHGDVKQTASCLNASCLYTSAKTGENVANAFLTIGREMAKKQLKL